MALWGLLLDLIKLQTRQAFRQVYGRYGSPFTAAFGPVIAPRTYLHALHLILMFPLGIAYFVGLVVMLSIGGAMIWTIVGPVVLIPALFLSRWAGDGEAWMVRHVTQIQLRRPPTVIDIRQSFRSQLWTRLIDRNTWTGLVYLLGQFPIGVTIFLGMVSMSTIAVVFIGAPIILAVSDATPDATLNFRVLGTEIDTFRESLVLVPIGFLIFFLGVHLVNVLSAFHSDWARFMLASRAKMIPTVPKKVDPFPARPGGMPEDTTREPAVDLKGPAAGSQAAGLASLTSREQEILGLVARGHSNAEIAETFVISEGTVKTHVKRVLAKLDVRDRTQATIYAYEAGFARTSEMANGSSDPVPIERYRVG